MDTSYDGKLECEISKNMGYGASSKSNRQLNFCINTPKMKHFNSSMVNVLSLGLCDFGSAINNFDMGLSPSVFLRPFHHFVASVKKKLCFEPTKSFTLNIGLLAVPESTLCDKLKGVRSLFYKIDGFGGASTPLKFPSIIWASFTSDSSLTMAKQLAVSKNLVINADFKKISIHSNQEIVIKEIPVDLPKSVIKSALGVNLVWIGLFSPKYAACENFGYILSGCESGEKDSGQGSKKKRFLCSDSDKRHLVLIYAKKQALISYLVFFGSATWASVVSGFPKNSYFTLIIGNNSSIGSVNSLMLVVKILALCVSVFEHSLENVLDQMADISHKLNRLLAVLSANFAVPPSSEHNPVLDMTVDALLFVSPVLSVITAISQEISPSGARVLTAKVGGLKANLAVLENLVKAILNKLDSFGFGSSMYDIIRWHMVLNNDISIITKTKLYSSIKPWIANKFPGVRVFTSSLDAGFLGAGMALIMNEKLAKHVSKISEILSRLLMVHLLFKNKKSVFVLGLYVETSLDKHMIQTGLVNSFIARVCNKSTFVILGGDFNEDRNKHSSSFSKCTDFGLVNILKTIDYIFVSQSLSNVLIKGCVVDVDEFFNTDHSSVQITIGLEQYKIASHDNFAMFSDEFTDFHSASDLDDMWSVIRKAVCFLANKVFSKTWSKDFDGGFIKSFSHYHRLELLVSKLVKASHSVSSIEFVFLLNVWAFLNSVNVSIIKSFFFQNLILMLLDQLWLVIDKRMKNFELNKGQTIRNVLERPFHKVTLNHLVVDENLILESGLVKSYVNRIMEDWTRKCVVADDILDEWRHQF
ncbi:hypothetical protein G9A89_007404 [Geosiphon pyriformis]|nr:hypothetical protein G9A89_007404 [Geosiphon pyriformis]